MSRIICDICGTSYSDTAQCCPICGSSKEFALDAPNNDELLSQAQPTEKKTGGLFSSGKKKQQFNIEDPDADTPLDVLDEKDAPSMPVRHNIFAVIALTTVITVLLVATGFLFFRFYLPHQIRSESTPESTEVMLSEETEPETIEETTVPCESLVLTAGVPEINKIGQYYLLHVIALPENTTDLITYVSSDETIVTVTKEGRLCAVGEGEATVVISCGDKQITCSVTVRIPQVSEPVSEETDVTEPES